MSMVPYVDLFIKLGVIHDRSGRALDGEKTIRAFARKAASYGYSWWGVSSLPRGMSPQRVRWFRQALAEGQQLRVYFVIHNEHYDNDIAYRARITDIVSGPDPRPSPDPRSHPSRLRSGRAACWLQLKDIQPETGRKAADFLIASTGRDLKWAICHSQYKFGYIEEK